MTLPIEGGAMRQWEGEETVGDGMVTSRLLLGERGRFDAVTLRRGGWVEITGNGEGKLRRVAMK